MTIEELKQSLVSFRGVMEIDRDNLEEECRKQPSLFEQVGTLAAEARVLAKVSKEHSDFVKAKLSSDIRSNPSVYGLDKVTEASLSAAVLIHPDCQTSIAESIETSRIADAFGILQNAAEQRKSMLKSLTELFVHSYYQSNVNQVGSGKFSNTDSAIQAIEDFRNRNRENIADVIED
jgi:hypothetical protein